MACPVALPPNVVAEDLEDDLSLPVMQFSSMTTALLDAHYSDHPNVTGNSGFESSDTREAQHRISGCYPRRTHEQESGPGLLALTTSRHTSERSGKRAIDCSFIQPGPRMSEINYLVQEGSSPNEPPACEACAQPVKESSGGYIANRTACTNMLPMFGDESQAQATPPIMSLTRIGGRTLNRPARRFRIAACETLAVGSDNNKSEPVAEEADVENYHERQGTPATTCDRAYEQTPYVPPLSCPTLYKKVNRALGAMFLAESHRSSSAVASGHLPETVISSISEHSQSFNVHGSVQRPIIKSSPQLCSNEISLPVQTIFPQTAASETATNFIRSTTTSKGNRNKTRMTVNGIPFWRLDCIGKGGSARVYRVISEDSMLFALKKVSLRGVDEIGARAFKGEIELLKKLRKVERVVKLLDWEFNTSRNCLNLLMELGEIDLETVLKRQADSEDSRLDFVFIRHYWREMLECVASVHRYDIVHSDLKPANFLIVGRGLKLIDFGIAGTIQEDTTNVHRENHVGTPNYMAPEALLDSNITDDLPKGRSKLVRIGKPSDVWSLGCILYLMVYGTQPFGHVQGAMRKAIAITNPQYPISYPMTDTYGEEIPAVCRTTLKACLTWDPDLRPTTKTLLDRSNRFLYPDQVDGLKENLTLQSLTMLVQHTVTNCETFRIPSNDESRLQL